MNETLIFGLLDGVCFVVFWFYSRCFLTSEKLLKKEESKRWLAGLKGVVMISFFLILCAMTGSKAAFLSLAILTPIGLTAQFLCKRKI
jgi:predicted Co/Zn/Cd cation transporter (cation efflux family)